MLSLPALGDEEAPPAALDLPDGEAPRSEGGAEVRLEQLQVVEAHVIGGSKRPLLWAPSILKGFYIEFS
ncbi:MAG: hypothetical protein PHI12_11230 [Dehalococcoidales bacterium]|nr:hypothetical protein [Dehalococcoidales bacterium]